MNSDTMGNDDTATVAAFVEQTQITFPAGIELSASYTPLRNAVDSISPYPLDLIVDTSGNIAYLAGEYDPDAMAATSTCSCHAPGGGSCLQWTDPSGGFSRRTTGNRVSRTDPAPGTRLALISSMLSTRTQILLSLSFLTSACGSGGTDPGDGDGDDASEGSDALPASCAGLVGEGNAVGQIAENWTLLDRDGFEVHLHDYCGKVIYIENGAEW